MSIKDLHFMYVGHYQKDSSDKIWGIIKSGNNTYSFWGRRTGAPSFKKIDESVDLWSIYHNVSKKADEGYIFSVSASHNTRWSLNSLGFTEGQDRIKKLKIDEEKFNQAFVLALLGKHK